LEEKTCVNKKTEVLVNKMEIESTENESPEKPRVRVSPQNESLFLCWLFSEEYPEE
jgi:hypothetical protein